MTDKAPVLHIYSIETVIAEKTDAILSLMEFSSRMKDYYDIYYLANRFDFDGAILSQALQKTFANRGHSFSLEQFERVICFENDMAMQKKWKAFIRKIGIQTEDYSSVLKTIDAFLTMPMTAALQDITYTGQWLVEKGMWVSQRPQNDQRDTQKP